MRAAETKQLVHIVDLREYVASNPADKDAAAFAKLSGVRTFLIVPMLSPMKRSRYCAANGVFNVYSGCAGLTRERSLLTRRLRGVGHVAVPGKARSNRAGALAYEIVLCTSFCDRQKSPGEDIRGRVVGRCEMHDTGQKRPSDGAPRT